MDRRTDIERAFSRGSLTYPQSAALQKEVALELLRRFHLPSSGNFLEIGSGTGFLTRELLKAAPEKLFANDVSLRMLSQLPNDQRVIKIHGDGEALIFPEELDLIASSFTFQWFRDLPNSLVKLVDRLRKGGKLIASLPLNPSFDEWRRFTSEKGVPYTLNPLYEEKDLLDQLRARGYPLKFSQKSYPLSFLSKWKFLAWFKELGANISLREEKLPLTFLKELGKNGEPFTTRVTVGFLEVEHV